MGQTASLSASALGGFLLTGGNAAGALSGAMLKASPRIAAMTTGATVGAVAGGPTGALSGASLASSLYSIKDAKKNPLVPALPTIPALPDARAESLANAQAGMNASLLTQRRRGMGGQSSTLLTGPRGIAERATTASTLLR